MTSALYFQKAVMQLSRGSYEKAMESLTSALECEDEDTGSKVQSHCLLGEYFFLQGEYIKAYEHLIWISDRTCQLEQDYDDLLNEEIREAEVLLEIMQRFNLIIPQ